MKCCEAFVSNLLSALLWASPVEESFQSNHISASLKHPGDGGESVGGGGEGFMASENGAGARKRARREYILKQQTFRLLSQTVKMILASDTTVGPVRAGQGGCTAYVHN